jgi:hypothetical protein
MSGKALRYSFNYNEVRSLYKLHSDESVHKLYLRNFARKKIDDKLVVVDCFGGEGLLSKYWLSQGAELTVLEKNEARYGRLYEELKGKAPVVNENSLKWLRQQSDLDAYNVYELDASGMANNWIKTILSHKLTGKKLFAVTDGGKIAMRARAMLSPSLFDWPIERKNVRNVNANKHRDYLHIIREWWERLSKKHGFRIESWRYRECSHPKTAIYYIALVDFGQ